MSCPIAGSLFLGFLYNHIQRGKQNVKTVRKIIFRSILYVMPNCWSFSSLPHTIIYGHVGQHLTIIANGLCNLKITVSKLCREPRIAATIGDLS